MQTNKGKLRLEVTDNGGGFEPSGEVPGQDGWRTMRDRMQQLGGGCEITSIPGRGTTVTFTLPLSSTKL